MLEKASLTLKQQTSKQQQVSFDNAKRKQERTIGFGNNLWFGFGRSISTIRPPDGYGYNNVNTFPNGSYLESPLGYEQVGLHLDQINLEEWRGLIGGEICIEFNRIQNQNDDEFAFFKILKNKTTNETNFYYLQGDRWVIENPFNYKLGQTNQTTPDKSSKYNFKGTTFDYVVYKNTLYLVSGEEDFIGSDGNRTGLMKWDGTRWNGIPTGKAGFLLNNGQIGSTNLNTNGDVIDSNLYLYDSPNDFNPSLITLYKDRLLISGDRTNPIQTKLSEWNNPDNFVDNVLGAQTAPLTSKDSARASTFILPTGCDEINSLDVFNDVVYIGSNKGWFIYQLVQQNIGDNVQFQLDSIIQNNYTLAGSINQYSTIPFQNKLYFVTDYQVIPEFSAFELKSNTNSDRASGVYLRLSSLIDDWMRDIDLSTSCIGVYGDSILIGCKFQGDTQNTMTLLARPFYMSETETRWGFTIMDHIQPTYFFQNNRGCYFFNNDSGALFKISPSEFGIQRFQTNGNETNIETNIPTSIWQTNWTGYNPQRDSDISIKEFDYLKVSGYFSSGTNMRVVFNSDNPRLVDGHVEQNYYEFGFEHSFKYDIPSELDSQDIRYRYGALHHTLIFKIPRGVENTYRKCSLTFIMENSKYFRIEEFFGSSKEISGDGNLIITPKILKLCEEC